MKLEIKLLILFLLAFGSNCEEQRNRQVAPRHVCEVVDHIGELKGQRLVVQGILSWTGRHGRLGLLDCRPDHCPSHRAALAIYKAPKETSGGLDDSFDGMMEALPKQPIRQMIVVLEGTIQVQDDPVVPLALVVASVKSMKPVPLDGQKRSNYCD